MSDDLLLDVDTLDLSRVGQLRQPARVPTLTLLAHPDASRVGERATLPALARRGERVGVSRAEPELGHVGGPRRPVISPFVSRKPLWLEGLGGGAVRLDPTRTSTRVEVDGAPLTDPRELDAAALERGVVLLLGTHVAVLLHLAAPSGDEAAPGYGLVGVSDGLRQVREAIARLAPTDLPILVRGETGSGKELVARALHDASPRRAEAFVPVNMAAVPASLAASELFGHARGAFSGASDRHDGYFLRADDGTLFLDEIGDTPPEVQAALLRVLETGEIQAVGARRVQKANVRLVAATDANLEEAIASGRFRAPLLYRLANGEIRIPPLRERRADVGVLVVHFLREALRAHGREALLEPELTARHVWLPADLVARLATYRWPGNVRQLRNVCLAFAARALASDAPLTVDDPEWDRLLPEAAGRPGVPAVPPAPASAAAPRARRPSEIGEDELYEAMVAADYKLGDVAEGFGISRPALNDLVDKHPRLRRAIHLDRPELEAALAEEARTGEPAWRLLQVSKRGLQRRKGALGLG